MGFDMIYQTLPIDKEGQEQIWTDKECRADIYILPLLYSGLLRGHDWRKDKPIRDDCIGRLASSLLQSYPGIERRNVELDRWWDRLHYLLSEQRRASTHWIPNFKDAPDIGTTAIRGARRIGQDVTGGQGIHVRYTDAETVLDVAVFLQSLTENDLRVHYNLQKMYDAGVYKSRADDGEHEFVYLMRYFHELVSFYAEAVNHTEGVLVCLY